MEWPIYLIYYKESLPTSDVGHFVSNINFRLQAYFDQNGLIQKRNLSSFAQPLYRRIPLDDSANHRLSIAVLGSTDDGNHKKVAFTSFLRVVGISHAIAGRAGS